MTNAPTKEEKRPRRGTSPKRIRPAQKRAITDFHQQVLTGQYKSIEQTLLDAGYSEESAAQITNVMGGIRPYVEPLVEKLEAHRNRVLERMETAVDRATYGELVRSLDVSTRNIRLLTGKSTHNFALQAEHRHKLDALIEES